MTKEDEIIALLKRVEARLAEPTPQKAYLTTVEAAEYTGISKATLEEWRSKGPGGPAYVKLQSKVLYRVADLDGFMAERLVEVLK